MTLPLLTPTERARRVALGAAVLSIVFQSFGPIFVRKSEMKGLAFAFHRMWLAAVVYALIATALRKPVTRHAIRVSAPGGLFFAFNIATFFVAVNRTSVANATVIGALQPIALLMVVNRMFGERPTSRDVFWTAVSIGGVLIVVLGSSSAKTGDPVGDLLALAAMLGFAAYFVASKQARATLGTFEYQSALSVVAAIALAPVVVIAGDLDWPEISSWPWIVAMVALPGTGHLLMNYAHGYVRLSLMGVITVLAPASSAVLVWAVLDEKLVVVQVLGIAIAVCALALMMRTARNPYRPGQRTKVERVFTTLPPASTDTLNQRQRVAVEHRGGPLLVVAGAGTGKTKTLAARVAALLAEGVPPERILLLTFSRRAASEMLARATAHADGRAAAQVWGGTFHAVANRLLRYHASSLGLDPSFTVLDQGDSADMIGAVRSELGLGERGSRFPKKDTIVGIYSRMVNSQAKLDVVLARWFPWCGEHADPLREVFTAYTQRKRRHHVLDYDDLLLHWRALLVAPIAGDALRERFDHVLVDEYQDTNALQSDILRGLCPPATLTVVGDDAQAIYGFRAATAANMLEFETHHPGGTTIVLEDNYRSTAGILGLANAVLAQSDAHVPKVLRAARGEGRTPQLVLCRDEGAQSSFVCERILELREEGMELREQAVLFRAGHHAEHLELELARRDIPYVKYGGLKYLETAHVKDVLSLLRVLDNPADELAWNRVLTMLDGVGPATVRRVCDEIGVGAEGSSPLRTFLDRTPRLPESARVEADELRQAFDDIAAGSDGPSVDLERLGAFCRQVFARRYFDAEARLADLAQLTVAASATSSRSRFLAELTLDPPDRSTDLAGPPHLDDDWLTLSTIHSAKGAEWRAVHVIHAADGNIPSDMALSDRDGLEEERRLLYVALTRARDVLSVSMPQRYHVRRHGMDDRHLLAPLSRFLEPLRELCEERSVGSGGADDPAAHLAATISLTDEVDAALEALWT